MNKVIKTVIILAVIVLTGTVAFFITKSVMKVGSYNAAVYSAPPVSGNDWDSVLKKPVAAITLETLKAGDISATAGGAINLKDSRAKGIQESTSNIPVLTHLIHHDKYGDFLIDTGFDSIFSQQPSGHFEGLYKSYFNGRYALKEGQGIDKQLSDRKIKLSGVFLTHFHEHLAAAPVLSDDIPWYFGKGEQETDFFPFVFSRFLNNKKDIRTFDFTNAVELPITGKVIDIFGDGSLWALSTPGHTKGHVSYLVNGTRGQYLLTGDVMICRKNLELGVGTGTYCEDIELNQTQFEKLAKLLNTHPALKPVFGHESDSFPADGF